MSDIDKPIILDESLEKQPLKEPDTLSRTSSNEKYSISEDVSITITDTSDSVLNIDSRDRLKSDSSSILDSSTGSVKDEDRRGTITKKIPLSEFATLQGILAHQVDEGAPCLKCGPDQCSGLELHFWKKVCKNCGCPRGSHKIQKLIEEKKEVPKSILLQTADEDEEDYKELAVAAPPSKVSIKGKSDTHKLDQYNEEYVNSLREYYKDKRHNLNLPDDKKLSPEQLLALQQYINQTQGEQLVSPDVLQSHFHHLVRDQQLDRSDTEQRSRSNSSEQSDNTEPLPLHFLQALQLVQLSKEGSLGRPDSTSPHPILNHPGYNAATMPNNAQNGPDGDYDSQSDDSLTDSRTHSYSSEDRSRSEYTTTEDSYTKELSTVNEEEEYSPDSGNMNIRPRQDDSTIEMIDRLTDVSRIQQTETVIRNKDKQHSYTESYTSSSDESDDRRAPPPKPVRRNPESFDEMTQGDIVDYYTAVSPSGEFPNAQGVKRKGSPGVWVPPGLEPTTVKQYLAALPEDKRPVNTLGVQWRIKQLQTQLPRYDHNINYCHEMSPEEQEELYMFVENRKEKAQGQGEVKMFKKKEKKKCDKCGGLLECGVVADKVPGKVYHPGCFTCGTCDEILVDLIYFQFNGQLHCGRHHAELLRPRCHACDELIFGFEFITADGHEYHKEHFCCWECDTGLGGTKYVSHKGQPYCQICYEKLFCTRCVSCKEPIGVGVPVYRHGPLRWHGNPSCYSCSFCKRSLVNRTFMPTERYVYCSKNCFRCHESLKKTKGK